MNDIESERASLRRLAAGEPALTPDVSPLIRRGTHVLLAAIWLAALLAAVLAGWLLVSHARAHAQLTAISLEQYARRNVGLAAFVVDEFEEFLRQRGSLDAIATDPAAAEKLRSLNKWLPEGSATALVLPDGNVAASSQPLPSSTVNLADRRWFKAHAEEGRETYVGPAILSRVTKRFLYTYSAAYRASDGRLLGVINLGLPSDSITGLLSPDEHGVLLALVQHEGPVVAAQPFRKDMLGVPFPLPAPPPSTEMTYFGWLMGQYSAASVRNVPDLGLYAVAALPMMNVLRPLLLGTALGLSLLLMLTALVLRQSRLLQQKSREVEQALADNRVLFQEVHHRVKNNLQVISSLLRLETERLPPEVRPLLDDTRDRVRAIALVHEQIYRAASPSVVQLDHFLAELVKQLRASMMNPGSKLSVDLAPVTVPLDRAVPVAILATEAITNAIKHGLRDGEGSIEVSLRSSGGRNVISVRDGGPGHGDAGKAAGLGTRIMTALSRQLDGEWSSGPAEGGGTVFTLSWPASP